ncbi:MAG: PAS domain S-box protein [Proteobacteria bacterium]|nr:PAS domain S-box protein [Pseudomonadota bacterium]
MKTVLIVDDNTENLYFLEITLKGNGYGVMTATNGSEALESAIKMPPDLIISDILMPVMDGFILCRKWKEDEQLKHIPFIFYTATYTEPKDEKFALSLGADRFILKPQEPEILMHILAELFEEKYAAKPAAAKPLGEEMEFFRRHNEILFKKLEKKMSDLEIVNQKLKANEEALERNEGFLDSIIENIPDMLFVKEAETLNFVKFNKAGEKLLGMNRQYLIGKNDYDFFPENQANFFTEKDREVIEKKQLVDIPEEPIQTKLLGERILHTKKIPIIEMGGKAQYLLGISEDITERKLIEEALLSSEQKYRALMEYAPDAILIADPEGNILEANKKAEELLGYTEEELLGLKISQIHPKEELGKTMYTFREIAEQKIGSLIDTRVLRKDGKIVPVDITGTVIEYRGKRLIQGIFRDITEHKLAEKALRESEEKYRIVADNTYDWEYWLDRQDHFVYCSPSCERITGYKAEKFLADPGLLDRIIYPDHRPDFIFHKKSVCQADHIDEIEFLIIRSDGTERWIGHACQAIYDETGVFKGIRGSNRDITSRKLAEEVLQQTAIKLRKSLAGTIRAMSLTVETRDPYTAGHQRRVSDLAMVIAQEMDLSSDDIDKIRMAGLIHDIGKISVPAEILVKPGKLLDIEMSLIKVHSQSGYDILKDVELPYPIAEIVLQHHERLDGSGYPQGLKNGQILLESQIISVADVVEAIASHRPYRPALGVEVALEEIEKNKGNLYDAGVVDVCIKLFREKEFKFEPTGP